MDGTSGRRVRLIVEGIGVVAATLLLVGSWCFLVGILELKTKDLLAPWRDCAILAFLEPGLPARPPLGTWERTLNDFFERVPGSYLPGTLLVTSSAVLFVSGMVRGKVRVILPLAFLATNLLFVLLWMVSGTPIQQLPDSWLPQPRPASGLGYHRTWPELLLVVVLAALLLWGQSRLRLLGATCGRPQDHRGC